jgi:hypothetical protein
MPDLDIVDEAAAALEQLNLKLCSREVCSRTAADCMVDEILVPLADNPIIASLFATMKAYCCAEDPKNRPIH